MDRRRTFRLNAGFAPVVLGVVLVAVVIGTGGCGEEMARLETNQMELQALVQANAEQISEVVTCAQENQEQLQGAIANLRTTTEKLNADMQMVAQSHAKLQDAVAAQNKEVIGRVAGIEEGHDMLAAKLAATEAANRKLAAELEATRSQQTELAKLVNNNHKSVVARLADMDTNRTQLQAELENVRSITENLTQNVAVVAQAQTLLETAVQEQAAGQAAAVAKLRQDREAEVQGLRSRIEELAATAVAAQDTVAKLEQVVTADNAQLMQLLQSIEETRAQLATARTDGEGDGVSVAVLEQQQTDMKLQLEQLQGNMEAMVREVREDMEELQQNLARAREAE